MNIAIKRALVGTRLGRWVSVARDAYDLIRTPRVALGTIVNDQLSLRLLIGMVRGGETFLDVGSHIGSVIAEVQHRCPDAKIIAFEADPDKSLELRRKFPRVTVHGCALAERNGEGSFFVDQVESGYSSLSERPSSREIKVTLRRLDELVEHADFIKIDVEGAELGVLQGAADLVSRSAPVIMFESGPGNLLGFTKEGMFEWLAERDYCIMAPNRLAGTGGPMDLQAFLDSHEYPRRTTNYFAVPNARFEEIRARAKAC